MSDKNKPMAAAKGYLIALFLTFILGLLTIVEVTEVFSFCICGDKTCLCRTALALIGSVLIVVVGVLFLRKNRDLHI